MTPKHDLQTALIGEIISKFSSRQGAIDSVAEILSIGRESATRRMKGTTMISPNEMTKLCQHFDISLDQFIHKESDNVIFNYNHFIQPVKTFEDYLNQLLKNQQLALSLEGSKIYYATQEVPPFQYFFYPELTAFKLYVYGITVWGMDFLENNKCSLDIISPEVSEKAMECARLYALLPSVDLWSWGILNHSLNQIEYMAETDRFEPPELALNVCDLLLDLLNRHKLMAKLGKKFHKSSNSADSYGDFYLHYNELVNTNNTILLKSESLKVLFTTFGNPNFLRTMDPRTCSFFEKWFEKTISRSVAISVHSEKNRDYYFNRLNKMVLQLKKKIEYTIS